MGSPMWSYEDMVRETDRIFTHSKKTDENTSLDDLELRIKSYEHDGEFFFKCGIAAANILNDIGINGGCDEMNASIGGLSMFRKLIGTEDTELSKTYERSIPKKVLNGRAILDFIGNPYTFKGVCPVCRLEIIRKGDTNYCPCCGQKL